jgi:hypothetical protein
MGKPRQLCYDGAGRLNQVVDAATNTTETYVWNADGTLASFPGPGYTRLLEYDEEGRLVRIRQDYGGSNVQLAYECGYGFDGGRRWRKDYVNGVWTRYPCGVACGAGDLVEQTSDLSGGQWTVSALYLQGISLVRRNNEWHHFDPLGTAQVITNNSAQVVSNNLYDVFGVLRYEQGSAQTPWRMRDWRHNDEALVHIRGGVYSPRAAVALNPCQLYPLPVPLPLPGPSDTAKACELQLQQCRLVAQGTLAVCLGICAAIVARGPGICQPLCLTLAPPPLKPFCGLICEAASLSAGVLCGLGCRAIYGKMLDECQRQYEECMRRSKMPMLRLAPASPSFQ